MPRPPIVPGQPSSRTVTFRVTDEQYEALRVAADDYGLSVAEYARLALVPDAAPTRAGKRSRVRTVELAALRVTEHGDGTVRLAAVERGELPVILDVNPGAGTMLVGTLAQEAAL